MKALGKKGLLDWNLDAGEKKWPWRLVLTPDIRGPAGCPLIKPA